MIGCGNMATLGHLPACQAEGIEIVAAADPSTDRLAIFAEAAGIDSQDCATTPADVLERPDVDAVIVASPPAFRPAIVVAAAQAGKHVLAEKPFATVPADGWAMVGAARAAGVHLAVVHNYLLRPDFKAVKKLLDSGIIGDPYVVTLNFLGVPEGRSVAEYMPTWRRDARIGGGGVLMDMLHGVYLIEWLMGQPIRGVNAALAQRQAGTVEDLALCRYEFEAGFGLLNMAWGHGPGGLEIMGTEGRLMLFNADYGTTPFSPPELLHVYRGKERVTVPPLEPMDKGATMRGVEANFRRVVAGLEEPIATGEHGVLALEAVVGAYASAARQRTVRLPLDPDDAVYQHGLEALLEHETGAPALLASA